VSGCGEVFFGYSYASLEALQAAKRAGWLTIVDQIDPGPVEFRLVAEEMARHPELAGPPPDFPTTYFDRVRQEWEIADVILVNSDWTREAIIAEGADPAKVEILPLAFEPGPADAADGRSTLHAPRSTHLRVLWLGQVNVRKGIRYLLEAARLLEKEPVEFHIAGPVKMRPEIVRSAPSSVRWRGAVPRTEASRLYNECDLFVLPTLSDGFAITQIEAMAHGLPVITTPNCGRVVEEGRTGFIVPARDSQALADAILRFVRDRDLGPAMAPECRAAAGTFSIDAYGESLVGIIRKHLECLKPVAADARRL
jgi:glycosyltransferase involved in cell wall biosynthesis